MKCWQPDPTNVPARVSTYVPFLRCRNQRKVTALRWENLLPRAPGADMRIARSWAPRVLLLVSACLTSPALVLSQDVELPADYGIDLQLAEAGRSKFMAGRSEITGTAARKTGDEVFQ